MPTTFKLIVEKAELIKVSPPPLMSCNLRSAKRRPEMFLGASSFQKSFVGDNRIDHHNDINSNNDVKTAVGAKPTSRVAIINKVCNSNNRLSTREKVDILTAFPKRAPNRHERDEKRLH